MRIVAIGFVCIFFNACSRAPAIRALPADAVILAFGDSLTSGTGVAPEESYPAVLQRLIGRTVINAGVPGELSRDGRSRLPHLVEPLNPSLVLICHGGNDFLQQRGQDEVRQNLTEMIQFLQARGIDIILIGVPQVSLLQRTAPLYRELAKKYHLPYEGKVLSEIISTPSLKSDQIHPNAQGYQKLAEAIANLIPTP